jgi:pilus assembly protein CpaC
VRVEPVLDTLVLRGSVPDPTAADQVVQLAGIYAKKVQNQMRVAGVQQVLLRCTVAEVNKRALRQLGLNGWMAGDNFQDAFLVQQLGGINPANIGAAANTNVAGTVPILTGTNGIPLVQATTFSVGFPSVQMQLFVQALRENGLLRVLAEPNLVAITGQTASFLAGGEFPVPIPQYQDTITIEFKEFGVRLNFTPTVLGGQMIRLRVAPEVSEPDFSTAVQFAGFVIPGLTQRKAETTVEIGNGQTMAIAGLLSEELRGVARKIPGLGDIPVLGALFSSVEYRKSNTELVILVTPELAEAMTPGQVPTVPGEFMTEPNDFELFGLGLLEGRVSRPEGAEPTAPTTQPADASAEAQAAAPAGAGLVGRYGAADYEEAQ